MENINGNSEEYDDPILYDKENDSYRQDLPYLLKWAAKTEGPIIDLACGTGRATIPLARKGYELIGVDVHKGMLDEAKRKSSDLNVHIEWIEQDARRLTLNVRSRLIFSVGNSFQHFLTNEDQDGFLSSVNKHLELDGLFIFDMRFPSTEELLQPDTEEYWRTIEDKDTQKRIDVYTKSTYDSLSQVQHYTTIRKYVDQSGEIVDEHRTNIRLRYVFPKEMERILAVNGLEIDRIFEDWNETPVTNDSYGMVYVCKKTRDIKTSLCVGVSNGSLG
ncbi:class I SAM-dependent DNA methyltransferase [Peribacillus sp. NPDC097264]|uniref:class I SAM-dependent DNA methyltransferase n=1 Tax=Peribacillus sp. NPDC097264 TaxID=3390616 RepID=UPI003D08AFFE